ncbi:MAG: hypothetical protein PWP56_692 [Acetobacterium sp.]|jgi:hypothetical protein|nr:hypothetical protein [Acetobacterium sp.]
MQRMHGINRKRACLQVTKVILRHALKTEKHVKDNKNYRLWLQSRTFFILWVTIALIAARPGPKY